MLYWLLTGWDETHLKRCHRQVTIFCARETAIGIGQRDPSNRLLVILPNCLTKYAERRFDKRHHPPYPSGDESLVFLNNRKCEGLRGFCRRFLF
jgi:hypothetical protein